MPSAIVEPPFTVKILPSLTDSYILGEIFVWTPITFTSGLILFAASATPEISPPPPIGTTIISTSGIFSKISSPIVPCPAITFSSSKGAIKVKPSSLESFAA